MDHAQAEIIVRCMIVIALSSVAVGLRALASWIVRGGK
jgi:hypothetical protein